LLKACAERGVAGLAAPSANLFGRISPTSATHVQTDFGDALTVLDGGPCSVGIESTIVDCTRGGPVLLRPGHITAQAIEEATGLRVRRPGEPLQFDLAHPLEASKTDSTAAQPAPKASGTLEAHYAPRARVQLCGASEMVELAATLLHQGGSAKLGVYSQQALPLEGLVWRPMPALAHLCAQQLFAQLREFDDQHVDVILVETPAVGQEWDGVRDRLQRAAASA
jgi:L-threonylcarbamoyladenylate synthase